MLGLGAAELLGDLRDDRLQLGDRERHGALEPLDLGRDLARSSSICGSPDPKTESTR